MIQTDTYKSSENRKLHQNRLFQLSDIIFLFSWFLISCNSNTREPDGNGLNSITIGDQVWSASNLDVVTFRNGDSIPEARSKAAWEKAGKERKPAWCYYENDSKNGKKYGRLYNWYAVNDARNFCPQGWHVPTNDEWRILENFLGNSEAGLRLKCNADSSKNGHSNNSNKFCALLGGYRGKEGGFSGIEEFTYLSSSTERDQKENDIWGRGIHSAESTIMRCGLYKEHGVYVRLIKD